MKKINYLFLGLAGLAMASCSQEDIQAPGSNVDGNVRVTVKLPSDMATRALNDGLTANTLKYAVYDISNNNAFILEGTTTFGNSLETTVGFNLVNGSNYYISFFAQSEADANATTNQVYDYNAEDGTITVHYENMTNEGNQADLYDCFVNLLETGTVGTDVVETSVVLYRPVAQINWGTNDLSTPMVQPYFGKPNDNSVAYPLPYMQSDLTTKAYNTFSILNNDVDTSVEQVTVNLNNFTQLLGGTTVVNNVKLAGFPVSGYSYVAMQYLLAPQEGGVYDLDLAINNGRTNDAANPTTADKEISYVVNVASAPVQANYRTNIYGALLTEDVEVTVVKSPYWGGAYDLPQGDLGESVGDEEGDIYYNASIKTYTIMTPAGLEWYAENVAAKAGQQTLAGTTVLLGDDLDMKGVQHTPFNNAGATFDGQGHTVSNLTVTAQDGNSAGFMSTAIGTVRNINFTNATITGNYKCGVLAGDGLVAHISGITVDGAVITSTPWLKNGTYDDGNNVGGIVGYLSAEGKAEVTDCSVSNATITAYRKVGGIVGFANMATAVVENNSVSNCTITANQNIKGTYDNGTAYEFLAGEVCGGWADGATVRDNYVSEVSVYMVSSEGAYIITSIEQFQSLVNDGWKAYYGKTFEFEKDAVIDLGGATIEPIDMLAVSDYTNCTINGNGVTIKNFKITAMGKGSHTGLFSNVHGSISGFNIENMTIETTANGCVGVVGYMVGNVSDIHVSNSRIITTHEDAGAIVGLFTEGSYTMTNCSATNCTIKAADRAGGLVGCANSGGNREFIDCTVTGCTITSDTPNGENSGAGTILGVPYAGTTATFNNCTVSGTTVNGVADSTPGNN